MQAWQVFPDMVVLFCDFQYAFLALGDPRSILVVLDPSG
jgi:hypothetical protein